MRAAHAGRESGTAGLTMSTQPSPLAGQFAGADALIDVAALTAAYYDLRPHPSEPAQRVVFGTSGHRGSALDGSFNEWHVLAITQAICQERKAHGVTGPLYLGVDTHALSAPACASALEVLAANGVHTLLATHDEPTPTPAVSHAILAHNRQRQGPPGEALADGIVITPSHNSPLSGGLKYNPPHGGPAGPAITARIEDTANRLLERELGGVHRMSHAQALRAATTHRHDFLHAYVNGLASVIDMEVIREARVRIGVDPLGGAGVHYWAAIAERHGLDLQVISDAVDPTFGFVPLDADGCLRMDPSSPWTLRRLIDLRQRFDIAFACDADHDRHGIVTPGAGLLPASHYQPVAIDYLFRLRPRWGQHTGIGKTIVSTQLIDRLATRLHRPLYEVPVGFKWYAPGLLEGTLGFAGEDSGGASFLRGDGQVWTTDKDGITAALLAAEITARTGQDPGAHYLALANELGQPLNERVQAPATPAQKARLAGLSAHDVKAHTLAGERIERITTHAPGNRAAIGGLKVNTASGWFVARPSGTEDIYRICAESFAGPQHLQRLLEEAQALVDAVLGADEG